MKRKCSPNNKIQKFFHEFWKKSWKLVMGGCNSICMDCLRNIINIFILATQNNDAKCCKLSGNISMWCIFAKQKLPFLTFNIWNIFDLCPLGLKCQQFFTFYLEIYTHFDSIFYHEIDITKIYICIKYWKSWREFSSGSPFSGALFMLLKLNF